MDLLTSNQQVIVERVPIEFADITYYVNPNIKTDLRSNQRLKKTKINTTNNEQ